VLIQYNLGCIIELTQILRIDAASEIKIFTLLLRKSSKHQELRS
jgi:hypothetical protein